MAMPEMLWSRSKNLTHLIPSMKLFTAISVSPYVGSLLTAASPAGQISCQAIFSNAVIFPLGSQNIQCSS